MDVTIVSPESEVWRGDADLVVARSPEGEFGIMNGHIPFLAALVPGRVRVVLGGDSEDDYHVIVLADEADDLSDHDASEARARLEEARRQHEKDQDERTQARLQIELARVEIAESRGQ